MAKRTTLSFQKIMCITRQIGPAFYYRHSKGVAGILARSELTNRTEHMVQINHLFLWAVQHATVVALAPNDLSAAAGRLRA